MTSFFRVVLVTISFMVLTSFSVSEVAFALILLGQFSESLSHALPFHQSSPIFSIDIPRLTISAGYLVVFTYREAISFFPCILSARFFTTICSYRFVESSVTQLNYQSMQPVFLLNNQ